jgi:predicted RNA-binding Zn ribbon-like protein
METRAPAPGALALVEAFENTVDLESGEDELATPEALAAWLAARGLLGEGEGERLTEADRARAVSAREALRALLLANGGSPPDPEAPRTLDRIGASARLRMSFDAHGRARLVPAGSGMDAALGRLFAIVDDAMREGTWARLKACREDSCRWAFYDSSKNRSGAWCTMAVCGNRAKARAYRQRRGHSSRTARADPAGAPARPGGAVTAGTDQRDHQR